MTDGAPEATRRLLAQLQRQEAPGLQYRMVSPRGVVAAADLGVADLAEERPVQADTRFCGYSVTKTLTAAAVVQLAERGRLSLDDPVRRYIEDLPYPATITIRHLLTHTAGLPNPLPLRWTHPPDEHDRFDRDRFFREVMARHPNVAAAPGARVRYSNLGYHLLGMVIERAGGKPYEAWVADEILGPAGIAPAHLSFDLATGPVARGYHRRRSVTFPMIRLLLGGRAFGAATGGWQAFQPALVNGTAYGGLVGTADGFGRYLKLLIGSAGPLAAAADVLMTEHQLPGGRPSGIGLAWFAGTLSGHAYRHHAGGGGGYYAEIRVYPSRSRASVLLLNRSGFTNRNLLDRIDAALI